VASDGSRPLSSRDAARIAEAFELSPDQVHEDADLTADWQGEEHVLKGLLRERHDWDASVPSFYVFWLRGDGPEHPE
jgi:hypothetical protein